MSRLRCAIVPPVPVPYREPLWDALARDEELALRVIYQSDRQPGWDMPAAWFPHEHAYEAVHLRSRQRARAGGTPIIWPRGLERALWRFSPEVVVAWEYGPASLRAYAWCRARRRAFVIFSECTPAVEARLGAGQRRLHRWLARRADGFVVASSAARARLLGLGVPAERIAVSVQAADTAALRAIPREPAALPATGRPVRFLAVGRLVPDKNFGGLIAAFAEAGLGPERAELALYGTGPLAAELSAQARERGVALRLGGHADAAALAEAYRDADAFVLPSTFEPFGVVVREAAAAGLPIVCSRLAGAAGDVAVEGESALLVDPHDAGEIGRALRRLAGDVELRERLGAGGRAIEARLAEEGVVAFRRALASAARRRA